MELSLIFSLFILMVGGVGLRVSVAESSVLQPIQISIATNAQHLYSLSGEFTVQASSVSTWNTLSDYEHLSTFVSSVKSCRIIQNDLNSKIIEQTMDGHAGFFHRKVNLRLEIFEAPLQKITFEETSRASFQSYSGSWEIFSEGDSSRVVYKLEAIPKFFAPKFIAVGAFKNSVKLLLEEVRTEIIRRQNERS